MRRAMTIALSVMMVGVVTSSAMAAWPTSPKESLPVCIAPGVQSSAQVVSDGAGGVIVVWQDSRSGTNYDIYAQRVLASGVVDPSWPSDGRALCTAANSQQSPTIVSDGAGGAIVVWIDSRTSGSGWDIYAQHVLASGMVDPMWPVNGRALCTATANQLTPQSISDGAGGVIVTWYDERNGNPDVYAQRVLASGAVDPAWPVDGRALCTATNNQSQMQLVSDGTGGAVVVWQDSRSGGWDIYAQRVLASGVVDSSWPLDGRPLCTAGDEQSYPAIVSDGGAGAIVFWMDRRSGAGYHIYAQRVLASGVVDPAWPSDGRAMCTAANNQYYPQAVSDGSGGAIVTWMDSRTGGWDLYARRVLASGIPDGAWPINGRALCTTANSQLSPQPVSDGAGGAIVVWQDYRSGSWDVYAQHILSSGAIAPNWDVNGNAVGVLASNKYPSRPIVGPSGDVIVVWADETSTDLHGQRFDVAGTFGSTGPRIKKILDVPNDEGGRVKLLWSASLMEEVSLVGVDRYWVLRSVPESAVPRAVVEADMMHSSDDLAPGGVGVVLRTTISGTDYFWELIGEQPAFHQDGYSYVAATTSDSLPGSNPHTAFMIMARNGDGSVYYFSRPDSGYSVDNLSPPTPATFVAQYLGTAVALHWSKSAASDFKEFRLYRVPTAATVPGPEHLLSSSPDTGFVDNPPLGAGDVYKLAAVDVHGNVSRFAIVTPATPVSTLAALVSANWTGSGAELVWFGGALAGTEVTVHREEDGAGWSEFATLTGDGEGFVRFTDTDVLPGHRYGYRLRFMEAGEERLAGTAYIEIPAGRLAIQSVAPNPVTSDRLSLRVSLAETGPARVRVLDLAGRIVREQQVPTSLTGQFDVSLSGGSPLRPGVYIVELRQGGARATTRFTYLR